MPESADPPRQNQHPPHGGQTGRRWVFRAARVTLVLAAITAAAGTAAWYWRVPLVNRLLLSGTSVWRIRVGEIVLIPDGVRLTGLEVRHVDQPEPVFAAATLTSSSGWESLRHGKLGRVTVESPSVHWRGGLRQDTPGPWRGPALEPQITWETLTLTGGSVDLASPDFFSLKARAEGHGGGGAWYEDGRLELSGQNLTLAGAEWTMNLREGPLSDFAVSAGQVDLAGTLRAVDGILEISRAEFARTGVRLTKRQSVRAPASAQSTSPMTVPEAAVVKKEEEEKEPGVSGPRNMVTGVRLKALRAPELEAEATLPWRVSAKTALSLESLEAGGDVPFGMSGLRLDHASAVLPGGAALPEFTLAAAWRNGGPVVESLTFAGGEVPDAGALLRLLGMTPPENLKISFRAGGRLKSLNPGVPAAGAGTGTGEKPGTAARLNDEAGDPMQAGSGGTGQGTEEGGDSRPGPVLTSGETQSLVLENVKVEVPGETAVQVARMTVEGVPDEMFQSRRLRRLELESPALELKLAGALQPSAFSPTPFASLVEGTESKKKPDQPAAWEGWTADTLKVSDGRFSATLPASSGGGLLTADFAVETLPHGSTAPGRGVAESGGGGPFYRITLAHPSLAHPEFLSQPAARASAVRLTASATGLWQRRELDSLTVEGARLLIGEGLFQMVNDRGPARPGSPSSPPAAAATVEPPLVHTPPWRVRHIVLEDSLVTIDNIGGSRRLDIPVSRQEFHELPLDAGALSAVNRVYKVEVPNITLYNPWGDGQKVAELDTSYIQFTPAGLLERRLERVDLMLPSIYAGRPLNEFVEAARQRFGEMAAHPPAGPPPLLADAGGRQSLSTLSALATVTPSEAAQAADWHIPFYTESGRVYVAPKGYPWPHIPVIPFRNARDAQGRPVPFLLQGESFHGELAIEPGWYDFPEYKVRLKLSNRGRIVFNTPQKEKDNNLTEVFENNTLIFRQLRIDDAWLSITYDASGIYARFGGHTCGGQLNGGMNLYLDELYTWDAWASLTGIGMKPFTDKLTPDTFRMSGPVDELTVKAYGDTTTLYQAVLDLKVSKPGTLQILALDAMRERIEALGGLSADLGRIGLETLRDFAYTGCAGELKLFGTEGHGRLSLTGPSGSRTFNLRLHDYRARLPKTLAPF